jgi:uncharacterized protein YkwD
LVWTTPFQPFTAEAETMKRPLFALLFALFLIHVPVCAHAAFSADPTSDTPWPYSSESTVADIQSRFNTARTNENGQLGSALPMLVLPSQSEWNALSQGEKALWLINRERIDRGIDPLHGIEENVTQVAQAYAQYLLDHDAFAHDADGRTPWDRLDSNPAIGACHDFLNVAENLAVLWGGWTLPVERSVYMWMYDDSGSGWGHRHAILWYPYNDNSGPSGKEGFMGIGVASGEHQGWSDSDIIVMDVFDPCASWSYSQTQYELSVTLRGPAGGQVQSAPGGIDCGVDCSQFFSPGQTVTLTASTDACVDFAGWSGGGCSGTGSCTVNLQDHTAVMADFAARDADADQVPDCQDSDPDTPNDAADAANAASGTTDGGGGGSGGGSGCFIGSMR